MSTSPGTEVMRDTHRRGEADAYWGAAPASALDPDSHHLRVNSTAPRLSTFITSKQPSSFKPSRWAIARQKRAEGNMCQSVILRPATGHHSKTESFRMKIRKLSQVELHQSVCLNLDAATESELWILPDFEEWEMDSETGDQLCLGEEGGEWAPLIAKAVDSNRDRLRLRLEGDGWDFVGGKYGNDDETLEIESGSEGSVDEEFDVVVLELSS